MPTKKRRSVDNRKPHGTTHRSAVDWEALLARIYADEFFGEGCLAGQPLRMATATAMEASVVTHFMNKFKKLGFIKYNGGLCVNSGLLSVLLAHDMAELTK